MPRPVHFEIPADNCERAVKFFTDVFGWTFNTYTPGLPYYLADTGTGAGINGAVAARNQTLSGVTNSIDVPSIDDFAEKIAAAGGTMIVAKMAIPGVGYSAYFKDSEGNTHGLFQEDPTAK